MDHHNKLPKVLAFLLGFVSIVSQVILLRELIIVFYGNETAYAIILASWLFWVSVGSFAISCVVKRLKNPLGLVILFQWIICFLLPATIFLARCLKSIMHFQTGEIIGIIPMCVAVYFLLAPLTFFIGGLFTLICRIGPFSDENNESAQRISGIYLWESIGAAIGGVIFSFVLIHWMSAMHIAFALSTIYALVILFLWSRRRVLFFVALSLVLFFIFSFPTKGITYLNNISYWFQWKGLNVIATTNSIYGHITLTKLGKSYSLYENGLLSYSTQDPLTSEESVHYALLEHPNPKQVLLIGNGIGGGIREVLKHPYARIDYVELDPKVIEVSQKYLPAEYLEPLKNPRVKVIHADARWFVKTTKQKYDVVIVGLSDPYTALINRYYTLEFFKEVKENLSPEGIIALSVTSSENYLNAETRAFLQSIHTTLRQVFAEVLSLPGDTNIFLACSQSGILTYDAKILTDRLKERKIATQYVREYYIPYRLSPDRIDYIEGVLKKEGRLNTDTRPIAYLFDIVLWSTHFNTTFKKIIEKAQNVSLGNLFIIPLVILLIGGLFARWRPASPITLSIITTGFSEIIFQLIVIFAFQTLYGYAYYKIGLIIASFMGGLVLGSLLARRVMVSSRFNSLRIYQYAQVSISLYPLVLPILFIVFRDVVSTQKYLGLFASVFAVLPVIAGFIGGLQYPLAVFLRRRMGGNGGESTAKSAGFLYAVDVLGATLGALVTGTILIPLFGITTVAYLCATINGAVLILLLFVRLK